jgi:hypothetical protein
MATDRFLIAPYDEKSGLQNNYKPWLIPDEAFSELNNAYVFRGRVRKRFGSRWMGDDPLLSRFRMSLTPAGLVVTTPENIVVGQQFSINADVFTVVSITGLPQNLLSTSSVTAQLTAANQVTFSAIASTVYWYPSLPVMGLLTYEQSTLEDESIIGFDTKYAYTYNTGWDRLAGAGVPGAAEWFGSDSQFFWATNWSGTNASDLVFYVTNFNPNEPNFMRYFFGGLWQNFNPQIDATPNFLNSARILVVFKSRLVAFNTWEGPAMSLPGTNYPNRARYAQVGDPLDSMAWRQDLPNKGNFIDAATTEQIVTVEFVKDRLIVYFERSTWEFVYTGNQAYPFTWQQINTELGAESTFSIVPFDKVCIGVGNVGIHACNGSNVERVDDKIPNEVFQVHNADSGIERVYGIRDFFVEMVYWTFPDTDASSVFPYPRRVLVLNYKTGTWAFNDDSITAFGYFQPTTGTTWDSTTVTWDDNDESSSWDSGAVQSLFRQVIGGNQQGYTFICDSDDPTNAPVLQITNIAQTSGPAYTTTLTIIQNNLREEDYIYITGIVWSDGSQVFNGRIYQVISQSMSDPDNVVIGPIDPTNPLDIVTGTYKGGGLVARVSQISISTKEYNFYAKQGRNAAINKVDFMVDSTAKGQIQVDFYVSTTTVPILQDSAGNGVLLGTGTLDTFPYTAANGALAPIPLEETAVRLWHPVYFQADGEVIQLQLILNDAQMRSVAVWESDFALHAICIYAQPTSYRFQ